jgi:carboxymethylenebutenolidase
MDRKKASDFPQELLNLFDGYVHGGLSRRQFMDGAQKFAVGGVTAAALFEALKPNYAWATQVPEDDKRIKTEEDTVPSPQGNGNIKGYLARPANAKKLPAVLVIHENRGLNPYIKDVARRLAVADFMAFAPDGLTSVGGYPGDDEKGADLFKQVDKPKMLEDLAAASSTSSPSIWAWRCRPGFRFMARSRARRTRPRSRRRSMRNMPNSTPASPAAGPRSTPR